MTPRGLRRKIKLLKKRLPITTAFERALTKQGIWSADGVWYKSQKEHWLGWLSEYDGPGFYNRKVNGDRSAEYSYNHIVCPPMVLWLAEASGVEKSLVTVAKRTALKAPASLPSMSAAIRKVVTWAIIERALK
jgi:hypothetical protein